MYSSVAMHNLGQLGPTEIFVSFSTKNKYSILKYISSLLVLDNQNNIVACV